MARRFKGLGKTGDRAKKKRIGWEGARRSAGLRGNIPIRQLARGLGGKNTEHIVKSNHRGSVANMNVRCGARLTINRLN